MAFEAPRSKLEYPPAAFSTKYERFLSPRGLLLSPNQVFHGKTLGKEAENNIRKAFKITLNRLRKMRDSCSNCGVTTGESGVQCQGCSNARYCSVECREAAAAVHLHVCHLLKQEALDQVLECLPNPLSLGPDLLRGRSGGVLGWKAWLDTHSHFRDSARSAAAVTKLWWPYTGTEYPGDEEVLRGLIRRITCVFSTVLTIAHAPLWLQQPRLFEGTPLISLRDGEEERSGQTVESDELKNLSFDKSVVIHLLGADRPEVTMVTSGIAQIISRVLSGRNVQLQLVAPDLTGHPQVLDMQPAAPSQVTPGLSVGCYPGLYHDFWIDHVAASDPKNKVPRPDAAIAIHPGCHTPEMWELWRPTLQLLRRESVPLLLTTYNEAEYQQTLSVLEDLPSKVLFKGRNPFGSLQHKRTPCEPDQVWATNAYLIAISNE